jgi:hypothetical protein
LEATDVAGCLESASVYGLLPPIRIVYRLRPSLLTGIEPGVNILSRFILFDKARKLVGLNQKG